MREDLERGVSTVIRELAADDAAGPSARTWVAAIRQGDAYACGLRDEYVAHLSRALAILVMALDLERVVLGTIVQGNPDLFLEPLRARLRREIWDTHGDLEVRPGELGERLPAYAALSVAELELPSA
jgi:predicted NBD/HSP70 family sugar kinase